MAHRRHHLNLSRNEKASICAFIFQCSFAFDQTAQKGQFDAGPYDLVYFGPTVQTIVVDPQLNSVLAPLPFDRFFHFRVLASGYIFSAIEWT